MSTSIMEEDKELIFHNPFDQCPYKEVFKEELKSVTRHLSEVSDLKDSQQEQRSLELKNAMKEHSEQNTEEFKKVYSKISDVETNLKKEISIIGDNLEKRMKEEIPKVIETSINQAIVKGLKVVLKGGFITIPSIIVIRWVNENFPAIVESIREFFGGK